jgi:hypothetical protein
MKEEVTYIAKRYNRGKFSVEKGWKRLNIRPAFKYTGLKIAAVISSVVFLSAAAAIIYQQYEVKKRSSKEHSGNRTTLCVSDGCENY